MSRYNHLSIYERSILQHYVNSKVSIRKIAEKLGRSPSTISRELKRNSIANTNSIDITIEKKYEAEEADKAYRLRISHAPKRHKLDDKRYADKVTELLQKYWSPEQISNRLRKENREISISTSTIYRGLESGLLAAELRIVLRIKGKHRCGGHKKSPCGHLNIEYTIHDRPKSVDNRKQTGHWESDTLRGAMWSGCIATHAERKSRMLVMGKTNDRTAKEFTEATIRAFNMIPANKVKSFTCDHGKEFSMHRELSEALGCKVYFADPHAPWQRGTNENLNGLLRQFFPKRTSFADVTQEDLDDIAYLLNSRPRKSLNWKSPIEVFFNKSLHLT